MSGNEEAVTASTLRARVQSHPRYRWLVLVTVGIGMMLAILSSSIVNIALPWMASDFGTSLDTIAWVVTIFMITQATLMPVAGRAGDVYGHRRIFIGGLAWFGAMSVLCAAAWNPAALIFGRGLQALSAAALATMGLAFVFASFPSDERPQALGIMGAIMGSAPVIGMTLGGVLVGTLGWRWIFIINVPLSLLIIAACLAVLKETEGKREDHFDAPGALLLTAGLYSGLLGLQNVSSWGWADWRILGAFGLMVLLLVLFVWRESRDPRPMLALSLLKIRSLVAGNVASFFASGAMFATTLLLPFFFKTVLGQEPTASGVELAPLALMYVLLAPVGGRMTTRVGSRSTALAGLAITGAAFLLLAFLLGAAASAPVVALAIGLSGVGLGLTNAPLTSAALHEAPADRRGIAASLPNMFRFVGGSFTIAVVSSFFTWRATGRLLSAGMPAADVTGALTGADSSVDILPVFRDAIAAAFQDVFFFSLVFVAISAASVLFIPRLLARHK